MSSLHKETFIFLEKLKKNNKREWFEKHKEEYTQIKKAFDNLLQEVAFKISEFDENIERALDEKKTVKQFRIYRDVRFSKDKTPYKTNIAGEISVKNKKFMQPVYYIHIEPEESFIGGGIYQPDPETLKKIREYIAENYKELEKILNNSTFNSIFSGLMEDGKLKTSPRDYSADHPAIEFLKYKNFVVSTELSKSKVLSADFSKEVVKIFKVFYPLNMFIYTALK